MFDICGRDYAVSWKLSQEQFPWHSEGASERRHPLMSNCKGECGSQLLFLSKEKANTTCWLWHQLRISSPSRGSSLKSTILRGEFYHSVIALDSSFTPIRCEPHCHSCWKIIRHEALAGKKSIYPLVDLTLAARDIYPWQPCCFLQGSWWDELAIQRLRFEWKTLQHGFCSAMRQQACFYPAAICMQNGFTF